MFDFLPREVDAYSDDIVAVALDNSASVEPGEVGTGSVRVCTMSGGRELHEPIVAFDQEDVRGRGGEARRPVREPGG